MMSPNLMLVIFSIILLRSEAVSKSPKKGLVIPHWPRHRVGDFEAFDTVSWWYNYHTIKEVYLIKKWWCTKDKGKTIPKDHSLSTRSRC